MTNHDETSNGPEGVHDETCTSPEEVHRDDAAQRPGLVDRLKALYQERPISFAILVIGTGALLFLLGCVVSGDISLVSNMRTGPLGP